MNRRNFMKSAASLMGAAGLAGLTGCAVKLTRKPNFVFILIDDLGWSDLPCYGNRFHETPNIDKLAKDGMRFSNAYAACPVCSPTRASIYSGQYPARIGLTDFIPGHWRPFAKVTVPKNDPQYLPLECVTLAEALKPAGYATGAFGKWHCGHGKKHAPDQQGFDDMVSMWGFRHFGNASYPDQELTEADYFSEVITDKAMEFIEKNRENPFLLFVNHFAVHIPLHAREKLIQKYKNKPKPNTGINHPIYAAMVEHADQSVGRILSKIKESGLEKDTVVVLFSDNGGLRQMYGERGDIVTTNAPLRGEKGTLYEGGIRVPLIVRWPRRILPGFTCTVPVTSVDFYPTFLELAGVNRDSNYELDGRSIWPLLRRQSGFKRDAIYWHYPHYHHSKPAGAVRAGNWKLIEFYEDGRLELYNLKEDLSETINLAESNPEKAKEMRQMLADWRESVGAKMPAPNPDYDPETSGEWGRHPDRSKVLDRLKAYE